MLRFLAMFSAVAVVAAVCAEPASAATFIDRRAPGDLRVATWNIYNDSIFPDVSPTRAAKFGRIVNAVDADVWAFQEVYNHTSGQMLSLMNSTRPLPGGASWHLYKSTEHVIASKYPLSLQAGDTSPAGYRPIAMALVDLPNNQFTRDLYIMNAHYRCCGGNDPLRQMQSDALVNWMRDARTPGGKVTLPHGTAMIVLGDLNIVESPQPLNTLLDGNIINNSVYGPDSAPDWDGSTNRDAHPLHNAIGPESYTWRNDNDIYAPGRLDFITYTDSVLTSPHRFVLNTVSMSAADLAAAGLQRFDSILDNFGLNYDHLPVVVDFREYFTDPNQFGVRPRLEQWSMVTIPEPTFGLMLIIGTLGTLRRRRS